ncbi:hypothetical protein PHLCEN_2v3193, partial [Hermanssonia centrifuga]
VAQILGTTKHITAKDSKAFAQEIGKYIDSKDQKRGDKKEKNAKEKDKDKGKRIIEKQTKNVIKEFRVHLSEARKLRKEAMDALAGLKKRQNKAQREECVLFTQRSRILLPQSDEMLIFFFFIKFSRDVLKEDLRIGLKDLDDAAAEQRDPDSFDPTRNIRSMF